MSPNDMRRAQAGRLRNTGNLVLPFTSAKISSPQRLRIFANLRLLFADSTCAMWTVCPTRFHRCVSERNHRE